MVAGARVRADEVVRNDPGSALKIAPQGRGDTGVKHMREIEFQLEQLERGVASAASRGMTRSSVSPTHA